MRYRRSIALALMSIVAVWIGFGLSSAGPQISDLRIPASDSALTVDGRLDDPFWSDAEEYQLEPDEPGVPASMGGTMTIRRRGDELVLAAFLPEEGGRIVARSIGRNPVWEKDEIASPPVEDRLAIRASTGGFDGALEIEINPWGAFQTKRRGELIHVVAVKTASRVTEDGWTVEAAVPLEEIADGGDPDEIDLQVQRIRSRRPLAPEYSWSWPAETPKPLTLETGSSVEPTIHRPPEIGNTDPPIEIGRVNQLPSMEPDWDSTEWTDVPEIHLRRAEAFPRAPRYATRLKLVQDGSQLALLVRAEEDQPLVANNGGPDAGVGSDDHIAVYLATSGSALVEILVNPAGAFRDSLYRGPRMTRADAGWDAAVETRTEIAYGAWTARVNIPLDECASKLGETETPDNWRILLVRYRATRDEAAEELSSFPVLNASSFLGPVRYRRMALSDKAPGQLPGLADDLPVSSVLAEISPDVWTPTLRRFHATRRMLQTHARNRVRGAMIEERKAWSEVDTLEDWERFRDERLEFFRDATADLGSEEVPLDVRVSRVIEGNGFRLHNLVYQSRPGFYMAANLYLPTEFRPPYPAMIINHSHHYPRTQGELQDMGALWARTGTAVLIVERFGFGERVETTPWYRQAYGSRFNFEKELSLLGESRYIWEAWDIIRGVDLFHERDDIDTDRIIVIGAVASGMQGAAFAGAIDERIAATITFNYDQGHVDMAEDLFGKFEHQFSPWLLMASLAPRKYVRAFEFGWEGAETPDYPELYFDGWKRSQKVWGFYDALPNLERSQAYGLIRLSMERVSHCFSIGPQQREDFYPILNRWFGVPYPSKEDLAILPDSELSVNPIRERAAKQEKERRLPVEDLLVVTPELASELPRVPLHQILHERATAALEAAREERAQLSAAERRTRLKSLLSELLGEIDPPNGVPSVTEVWTSRAGAFPVEALSVTVEEGIEVPMLLLLPESAMDGAVPVVIGVAQGGKERFLQDGSSLVELLRNGIAVCLPDLRGTGETKPDTDRTDFGQMRSLARTEFSLGNTMLGARLKDLRTVIAVLKGRDDIDAGRIALWGRSFVPVNDDPLYLDEIQYESGPQIQNWAEPLGAHLALLAGLYESDIRAIAAQNGLIGYLSVLDEAFNYVPYDAIIPGLLEVADTQDVAPALAPRPLLLGPFVNGRNQPVRDRDGWEASIGQGYTEAEAVHFETAFDADRTARWFIAQVQD